MPGPPGVPGLYVSFLQAFDVSDILETAKMVIPALMHSRLNLFPAHLDQRVKMAIQAQM
jgi:hypothetical protein